VAIALREAGLPGIEDAVAAYDAVGLYFRDRPCGVEEVRGAVEGLSISLEAVGKLFRIPACYELGPDLSQAAERLELPVDVLIALHSEETYDCFAVGFSPGFPYLGYLPERIARLPRLESPRARVEPGSIGVTGRQTGVYPSATPGGWWLIARTPLQIARVEDGYFPIEAGDRVEFYRIDEAEYRRLEGERL
jgi:inhibitor of KinA